MDAHNVMDTATKERYISQLNYKNRMKFEEAEQKQKAFQKEEENAFQMIPKRPNPFEIKTCTEDVNDDLEDYLLLDNYITVWPAREITKYEAKKSHGNEASNSQEIETAVSEKGISINIRTSDKIYDGDRGNEQNGHDKFTLQNKPLNHSNKLKGQGEKENTFEKWRRNRMAGIDVRGEHADSNETPMVGLIKSNNKQVQGELITVSRQINILPRISERVAETGINIDVDDSINDQPELAETSNVEVIRSQLKSKRKLLGVCMAVMLVMIAVTGVCFMVYYFTPSDTENSSENATATNDVPVTTYTNDVPLSTNVVPVTNTDANCTTFIMEKKITGKYYFKFYS